MTADGEPDDLDEKPSADAQEQAAVVSEEQILRPAGSREDASEADWIDQAVEVPIDEDEAPR